MFTSAFQFRYVLGKRRTFVYHNPSPCEIVYYIGQKITVEPPHEFAEDYTFVCFDDPESAIRAARHCTVWYKRVLLAERCTYDADLNKHLLWFKRFHGFLSESDPTILARQENPYSSRTVPGNPNKFVQHEISRLSEALEHMQSQGVSSSLLHLPIGYVWSSKMLKIIMLEVDHKKDHTSVEWNKIIVRDVNRFGTGLDKYFLKTSVVWPEKDSFMRCFSIRLQDENRRLPMIYHHPFLKDDLCDIFRIFTKVYWVFNAHYSEERMQLTRLMVALNSKQFKSEFMPNGDWTRQEMSLQFNAFLRGDPEGNSIKYNTNDLGDLVRLLRNLFQSGMIWNFFSEARRYWPNFVDRVYEKIAAFNNYKHLVVTSRILGFDR